MQRWVQQTWIWDFWISVSHGYWPTNISQAKLVVYPHGWTWSRFHRKKSSSAVLAVKRCCSCARYKPWSSTNRDNLSFNRVLNNFGHSVSGVCSAGGVRTMLPSNAVRFHMPKYRMLAAECIRVRSIAFFHSLPHEKLHAFSLYCAAPSKSSDANYREQTNSTILIQLRRMLHRYDSIDSVTLWYSVDLSKFFVIGRSSQCFKTVSSMRLSWSIIVWKLQTSQLLQCRTSKDRLVIGRTQNSL